MCEYEIKESDFENKQMVQVYYEMKYVSFDGLLYECGSVSAVYQTCVK